ncbi:MAG: TonB-dependent receptor [Bacteroidota bacterium]
MAQSPYNIRGKVVDAISGEPLPFATVLLFQTHDADTLRLGKNTDENGAFEFQHISAGTVKISVSLLGYKSQDTFCFIHENTLLNALKLTSDTKILKEVSVKAQKSAAKLNLDKQVFNVGDGITFSGGTAENLLRSIPTVSIDENGNAVLRNSTATIYVNGKPTPLSLAQIPANQIESVEVISNPSAKYEAAAAGGIVNLILKKNRSKGFNGLINGGIGNNNRYDGMLNIEWRSGKWGFSSMYNLNATKNPLNNYNYRKNFDQTGSITSFYDQNTQIKLNNNFQNIRLSADYSPNKRNVIALTGAFVSGQYNSITAQEFKYFDSAHLLSSYGARNTTPQNKLQNDGLELDWTHTYSRKGKKLSFLSAYNHNRVSNAADWRTVSLNSDGTNQPNSPENDKITGSSIGNQIVTQLDFVQPVNDSTKWEMGLRSLTYIRNQQYFFNQQLDAGPFMLQPDYSQNARITETVNAAYMLYSTQLRHGFNLEVGLRIEQSSLEGKSRMLPPSTFGYYYPAPTGKNWIKSLFPSFSLSKKLNDNTEIGLDGSRKIERPGWRQIFIGIQANDKQNITIGNPALQPEFVNTVELNLTKTFGKNKWFSSLYYIYEDNTIKPFTTISPTDSTVLITSFINAKVDIHGGWQNIATIYLGNSFTLVPNVDLYYYTLQTDSTSKSLWTSRTKLNLIYKFKSNFEVQLTGNYNFKTLSLQGYRGAEAGLDFAIRRSFWNNRGNIAFMMNDIFDSRRQISIYNQPNAYQESMTRREVRFYKISVQLPLNRHVTSNLKKKVNDTRPDVDFSN